MATHDLRRRWRHVPVPAHVSIIFVARVVVVLYTNVKVLQSYLEITNEGEQTFKLGLVDDIVLIISAIVFF